jgi:hypothetical protein
MSDDLKNKGCTPVALICLCLTVGYVACVLACVAGVIYVACHFIGKWW